MTRSVKEPRLPGSTLLKIACLVFDEPALRSYVVPVLADLQYEYRVAGSSRRKRLQARLHAYRAFWLLVAAAPFLVAPSSTVVGQRVARRSAWHDGPLLLLVVLLASAIWPMFSWFVLGATIGGIVLAIALRSWNDDHPSAIAPDHPLAGMPSPQINLSRIPVASDVGGLLFTAGSAAIVMIGVPDLRWFFVAAIALAFGVATALFRWRAAHPSTSAIENSIAPR